jgi:hypothetical protein
MIAIHSGHPKIQQHQLDVSPVCFIQLNALDGTGCGINGVPFKLQGCFDQRQDCAVVVNDEDGSWLGIAAEIHNLNDKRNPRASQDAPVQLHGIVPSRVSIPMSSFLIVFDIWNAGTSSVVAEWPS